MKLVIDANILIGALISQNPAVQALLEKAELHAPEVIKDEILRNMPVVANKSKLDEP